MKSLCILFILASQWYFQKLWTANIIVETKPSNTGETKGNQDYQALQGMPIKANKG